MAKLTDLSLSDLYARKITKSVETAIIGKQSFSSISEDWCNNVCKLACKQPTSSSFLTQTADVLIVQDYKALDDFKYGKSGSRIEQTNRNVLGYLARSAFGKHGVSSSTTSLLKCQFTKTDFYANKCRAPGDTIVSKCRPYLFEEIRKVKPRVIVSLATSVTKALGLKRTNYNDRGAIDVYKVDDSGIEIPVVITLHPRILLMLRQNSSGQFWGPDFYSVILRDFNKAAQIVKGELHAPILDKSIADWRNHIRIARRLGEVEAYCREIKEKGLAGKVVSYDLETTSLDPQADNAKILTAQFGFRGEDGKPEAIVFPLWHKCNNGYSPDKAWHHIADILKDSRIKKIGHNLKFDILYTYFTTGVNVQGVLWDTMLLLHSINSGLQGMYGLKRAVHDWMPDFGLGDYENKLPKLTKVKVTEEGEKVLVNEEGDVIEEERLEE